MKDVFLSHASSDKDDIVRPFANRLAEVGISFWLDEAEIKWGQKLSKSINDGLQNSRYVVIFLSKNFTGRSWTEAELSAALTRENSEKRSVVLPVIIGDPIEVLEPYPLLRDKIYKRWEGDIDSVVDSLRDLIHADRLLDKIPVEIKNTPHSIDVDPGPIIILLGKMDSHSVYRSEYFKVELNRCGLLVKCEENPERITINGYVLESVEPTFGKPGIWSLDFARLMWDLLIKRPPTLAFTGRGRQYRQLVSSLRHYLLGEDLSEELSNVGPA
ncbi:MAG: toll/interleukin-1 receptor domain-containing protein [bacterium]|nr:toll/interleukin-1 receptor domain-containing protein [bacterium]